MGTEGMLDAQAGTMERMFSALDERARLRAIGDRESAGPIEHQIEQDIHALGAACASRQATRKAEPPRAVQIAMATALFAAPHLGRTLTWAATPGQLPGFQPSPALSNALGLSLKELEELRDAADLRVSEILRQGRALTWLWQRSGDPRAQPRLLFDQLFPADGTQPPERFVRRGARLYAIFRDPHPLPPESLYLRWLPVRDDGCLWPDDTFQARYVDDLVVRAMVRSIGVPSESARTMLDNLVCVVPNADESRFLRRDRWRSEGWADLTGLARASDVPSWITSAMLPDALDDEPVLERTENGIACRHARRIFDRHATTRVTAAVQGLYAEICARQLSGEPPDTAALLRIFDLGTCIQRALGPLLTWPTQHSVHQHWAKQLQVPVNAVAAAMNQMQEVWMRAAQTSWGGSPTDERPVTVQTVLTSHLAATLHSMQRAWRAGGDPRIPHQPLILLFFASYVRQVPLGRLWRAPDGTLPAPEDVIGQWFGVMWRRVLDAYGIDEGEA